MKKEFEHKLVHLSKLVSEFKVMEKKLQADEKTPQLIASLMYNDFFYKHINTLSKLNAEQIDQLSVCQADDTIVNIARNFFVPMLGDVIKNLEAVINKNEKMRDQIPEDINESVDSILHALTQPASSQTKQAPQQNFLISNSVYRSYFSHSMLKRMLEHINTGRPTPPLRRFLSVCFLDIVGFSTMSESLEAVQVMDLLNDFFNKVNKTIDKHKGDIDKFIGDAMLITFESAENAVRCAMEIILKDLERINAIMEYKEFPEIKVHVGINTGWVVQGNVGSENRRETTVIGDGVNIAARLQALTPPDELWISSSTMASLGKLKTSFEQVGRRKLKGKAKKVMIYRHIRSVPDDCAVLFYEPDKSFKSRAVKEMFLAGIHDVETVVKSEDLKNKLHDAKFKVLLIGPSIDETKLENLVALAEKIRRIPILPIIKKLSDKKYVPLYEKLGMNVFVPVYKKNSMEKVSNTVINENVKEIPKLEKEPDPDEIKALMMALDQKFPDDEVEADDHEMDNVSKQQQAILAQEIMDTIAPETDEELESEESIEQRLKRKMRLTVNESEVTLSFKETLSEEEMDLMKKDLSNLWKYSFQKKSLVFIFDFSRLGPSMLSKKFLTYLLGLFDYNPEAATTNIKADFSEDSIQELWGQVKAKYDYNFLN